MKKWISVILALVTLCTLCTALPAGAAAPYAEYAYVYENFEDGQTPAGAENTLVAPGVGDVGYAVRRTITVTSEPLYFPLNLSGVAVGDNLKLSAWVRPKAGSEFGTVNFIFYGYDTNVDLATYTVSAPVPNFAQDTWSYVETMITWENLTEGGLAFADDAESLMLLVEAAIPGGAETLTYDIDDIVVEPTQVEMEKVYPNLAKDDLIDGTFDNFNDNAYVNTRSTAGWGLVSRNYAGKAKKYSESDPRPAGMAETSTGYLNIPKAEENVSGTINTNAAVGYGYSEIFIDQYGATTNRMLTLNPGHTYKVDYWARVHGDDTCTVEKFNPVFVHTVSSLPVDNNGLRTAESTTKYTYTTSTIEIPTNGGWKHIEYYLQLDFKYATVAGPAPISLQLIPVGGTSTKVMGASFDYDEIQILDLGIISNGDFEIGASNNVHYAWGGYKNKPVMTKDVVGWTPSQNAITSQTQPQVTLSQSNVVRPGATGHSMKVTVTTAGGYPYQAMGMEDGQKYKISFWAKGNNMPTDIYMAVSLTRTGNSPVTDSYPTAGTQYIWGSEPSQQAANLNNAPLVQRWKMTNEWQYYEFIYDNTFPLKSGLTEPIANTFPRIPWLQFTMKNPSDQSIPAGYEYYLDDFTIEPYDPLAPPVDTRKKEPFCSAIAFSGAATVGQPVGVTSYTYMSERDIPQATSVLRVLKKVGADQWAQVAVKSGNTPAQLQYTLPADLAGEDIRVEFIPMDTAGHFGTIYSEEYTVDAEVAASATFSGDSTTTPVSVSVDIANTAATSKNITVILALYDANNTMLDVKSVSVAVASGVPTTVPADPTSTALTADLAPTATKACVFILDGNSLANAGSIVWAMDDIALS